jgi:hypothetical protein
VDAQKEYLRAKRDNLHISEASEATKPSSNSGIAPVLERVQRYMRLGKKDMAARIIQKELKHLKNGSETVQQQELSVLYQSIGSASTASMRGIDKASKGLNLGAQMHDVSPGPLSENGLTGIND